MLYLRQPRRAALLMLAAFCAACTPKQPTPEAGAPPFDSLSISLPAAADSAVNPLPAPAPDTLALPKPKPIVPAKPKTRLARRTAAPKATAPVDTRPEWDGRPILASELPALLARLFQEADSMASRNPDSARARLNFALRYSDDGAFYALAARLALREKDPYRTFILAERGYLKGSKLSDSASEMNLRMQIQALHEIHAAAPSQESEAQYYQLANRYQVRFQHAVPEEP